MKQSNDTMFNLNYKNYYKKSVLNTFISCIVWSGLSTYVILSKGQIGETNIPIFETILFLLSVLTSKYISRNKINLLLALSLDIGIEVICLTVILVLTIINGVSVESAIALYILIILISGVSGIILTESTRDIEDKLLKTSTGKKFLKMIRGNHRDYRLYGLTIGGVISLLLLTYFKMDLKIYAVILISLNLAKNIYDIYIVRRYLIK